MKSCACCAKNSGKGGCVVSQALFPRSFRKDYPQAVRGQGCYIFTANGKKYLDAAGGGAVGGICHGVAAIRPALAAQAGQGAGRKRGVGGKRGEFGGGRVV